LVKNWWFLGEVFGKFEFGNLEFGWMKFVFEWCVLFGKMFGIVLVNWLSFEGDMKV